MTTQLDYTRTQAPTLVNVDRAEAVLGDAGVDAVIATSPENVAYASGYYCQSHWTIKGTLVFGVLDRRTPAEPIVVAPALELDAWAERPPQRPDRFYPCGTSAHQIGREVAGDADALAPDDRMIWELGFAEELHGDAVDALVRALADAGLADGRLALDEGGLDYRTRERIVDALPRAELVDGGALLRRIRQVKTAAEVERLERATEVCCAGLQAMMEMVEPGVTERDLAARFDSVVADEGGRPTFVVVSAGRRSGHTHPLASDYRLQAGDVVKYDVGCTWDLYHADIGRTQVVGEPTDEQARTYAALVAGEQAGIDALRPGVRPSEIFEIAVGAVRDAGLPNYRRHHVGHGIGIGVYDSPVLQPATSASEFSGLGRGDDPLEEGMVLNVETPLYVLGKHGMIVEDAVVVTGDGIRYLSHLPRQLTV